MRTHRFAVVPVVVLSTALLTGACGARNDGAPSDPDPLDLDGRTFVGDDVRVDDKPYPLVKGSQLRLTFEDGSLGASAGCNSMGGDASWDNGALVIVGEGLAMTEMACDEPLMQQDAWLAQILTSSPGLLQDDTTLTLTHEGTVIVLRDEEVVMPDASLTGTAWQLDSIIAGDSASSVPEGVESTIRFTESGEIQASPGCNSVTASYSVAEDTLTVRRMATTLMLCQGPEADVEDDVLGLLQGDVSFSIDGDSLTLTAREVKGQKPTTLIYRAS
jgi:heat shock protein HslJ